MDALTEQAVDLLWRLQDEGVLAYPVDVEVMRPVETADALDTWFEETEVDWRTLGHRLVQVAQDGTGSMFCLWYYPDLAGPPPVVFVGSEGELARVANDAADFARQIAQSSTFLGHVWVEPSTKDLRTLDFPALRGRVEAALGPWTATSDELQQEAVDRHPDFSAWVADRSGCERYEASDGPEARVHRS